MPHHAELTEESIAEHPSPANDPNVINLHDPALEFDDDPAPVPTPQRFGRLALWMASASALGIGVLGTVAYGMWFNHDQRVYAEAMTSARQTLGIDQTVVGTQTQSAGAVEAPTTTAPGYTRAHPTTDGPGPLDTPPLADANGTSTGSDTVGSGAIATAEAASTQANLSAEADGTPSDAPAQSAAVQRRGNGSATQSVASRAQSRRHVAHAKPEGGLFARMGAFFHRVSYRHNVPTRQREDYSRP